MRNRLGRSEATPGVEPQTPDRRHDAVEVQASVAKAHFSQLLDAVEDGASIVILRHGRPIARIVPARDGWAQRHEDAMENIGKLAREREEQFGPVSVEEIISSIHEGRKY